jgi:threonylcarbamoyladenosine tRNA methylthiotransferase MtaB
MNRLVASGVSEVVLTGVDLTAYGLDLPGQPTLSHTLKRLLRHVPTLTRLRLSSLDPAEVDEEFFQLMAHDHRLMPHVHLSLQAGDDLILKRMKRRHLRDHVISFCHKIRAARPDVLIGADVIAGFPTETDAQFQNTLELLQQTDIFLLHVFPFSPHPGTPAARMPQVPRPVVKERAGRLRQWSQARRQVFYESQRGQSVGALLEQPTYGHTDHFLPFTLAPGERAGEMGESVKIRLVGTVDQKLLGVRA